MLVVTSKGNIDNLLLLRMDHDYSYKEHLYRDYKMNLLWQGCTHQCKSNKSSVYKSTHYNRPENGFLHESSSYLGNTIYLPLLSTKLVSILIDTSFQTPFPHFVSVHAWVNSHHYSSAIA